MKKYWSCPLVTYRHTYFCNLNWLISIVWCSWAQPLHLSCLVCFFLLSGSMSTNTSFNISNLFADLLTYCSESRTSHLIFTAFSVSNISLLPLFIFVLYVGYQRWRKQLSGSTAVMMSHSDVFTYNVIALELIAILGTFFYCVGALINDSQIKQVGQDIFAFSSPGQNLFHVLTCIERYLAVVHPITYLGLRQEGGVRVRNISTGCVWLFCFVSLSFSKLFNKFLAFMTHCCLLVFYVCVATYCSLSVLCILIRPGPGKGDQERERMDQTKKRAFHTITAIMGALWLRFVGILVSSQLNESVQNLTACAVVVSAVWLTVPCSLVLPLLFLHRAGILTFCKKTTEWGWLRSYLGIHKQNDLPGELRLTF